MAVIEVKNLTKTYPLKRKKANNTLSNIIKAVDNVNFDVEEGQIVGLLGANGAGKTTIIKMMCGLVRPNEGSIFICGYDISKDMEKALEKIGAVIEEPSLYKNMTGMQNLEYFASLQGGLPRQRILDIVELVGMTAKINLNFGTYSLGMKQRVGIAQAIMHNPKILILDEPTNGLDAEGIFDMRVLLRKLVSEYKTTVLVSSHILSEMQEICDSIILMKDGKVIAQKSIEDILHEAIGKNVYKIECDKVEEAAEFIRNINPENIETKVKDGVLFIRTSSLDAAELNKNLIQNGYNVYSIISKPQTLENFYRGLINEK